MENKKRYLLIILGIVLISILGTFAWLTWKSKDTSLVLTIGDIVGTTVTLKPYTIEQSLIPTLTYEGNEVINVTAKNNGTTKNDIVLYYKINNIDEELITDSFKYTVLKSIDNGETYEEYQTGTFASSVSGEEYVIMTETIPENTTYNYRVYTWLDGENETSSNIQGKSFKAELRASIFNGSVVTVDVPSGLIPVTIANDGVVTTILENDESWYDYNNKLWANAVLVTESSRSTYLGTTGETIPESDILAYYVYVPRYKYKIWTTGTSSAGNEQEIEILFENVNISKSQGSKVGEYLTHPAFTFGETELNGIWVGKFETTGTEGNPTIKPNSSPLTNQNVSMQFQTSLKFAGGTLNNGVTAFAGSNTYGLSNNTNVHMAKNTEWSAAAYLSHSKYGINTEVRINNYYNNEMKTGCGASTTGASSSTTCGIAYGESSAYPQSTTGNITGVFDMSGGAWERVMGVFANSSGTLWSGNSTTENSGFNGLLGTGGTSYILGIDFPEEKYYNVYKASNGTTIEPLTACNSGYCYGHGLSEISGWYEDWSYFLYSEYPWFGYGGRYDRSSGSGVFHFGYTAGKVSINDSFRSILIDANSKDKTVNLSVDLNGGTSSQNLAGIYPASKQINLVNPTRSGYTFAGWKVTSGNGKITNNIFPDSSFENNVYSLSLSTASNLNEGISVTNEISMYGSYSLMNYHDLQYGSYYQEFNAMPNHKYYFSNYFYNKSFGVLDGNRALNYSDISFYYNSQDHWGGLGLDGGSILNEWHKVSVINTSPDVSSIIKVAACETNGTNKGQHFYIDGVLLIDLTETFGAGNEPSKEWMDINTDYFDTYMLYLFDQDTTIQAQWK